MKTHKKYKCPHCKGNGIIRFQDNFSDGKVHITYSGCLSCEGKKYISRSLFLKLVRLSSDSQSNLELVELYENCD